MTDERNSISRRNVLAGLGTIGVGGALAGAGTSAFFSDKETFDGNKLVTGALDLKVDWQEHYSDWSDEESLANDPTGIYSNENQFGEFGSTDADGRFEVLMEDPATMEGYDPENYIGFPSQADVPLIWVPNGYADDFLRSTAIEAYPDTNNDGIQDYAAFNEKGWDICKEQADTPNVLSSELRTDSTPDGIGWDPNPQVTNPETPDPLIDITDVKPGDFGELTLSFHLCDNPGYVWLTGALHEEGTSENGHTEPEATDPDEEPNRVELLDEIQTQFWIDDGDNVFEPDNGETLLFEEPLSLREALALLENNDNGLGIPIQPETGQNGTNSSGLSPGVCPQTGVDRTSTSQDDFAEDTRPYRNPFCTDYGLTEAIKVEAESDEPDEPVLPDSGACETYETPYGEIRVCVNQEGNISSWETDPDNADGFCVDKVIVKGGRANEGGGNIYHYDDPTDVGGETYIGSSGDDETTLTTQFGDISHVSFCVSLEPDGGNGDGERECFVNSTTYYVGFSWWLPVDHANEIQTDSASFDIGFYTEQCRHNDGSGMRPETDDS
ncbi:SipW-dependent-type signal peptide-containing protein [Natrinema sp. 1APR25-10V2]|uniref:SipW-dependent-type signal peptide-containing protein n=1 Tax=Natrinema sp. 1APR25-10V2 TaxID=2951081 RepID=UPI002875F902|nr:SipW-dependent-type signal peptide-containing protein [Natrinema sp. 1APR25-10V2]MDS0475080.1 SipW-dependent-type signal peptide-containing protein [Natrinema sp. 1APR25-10V2]